MVSLVSVVRPFLRSALVLVAVGTSMAAVPSAGAAATPSTHVSRPVCTSSLDDPQQRTATFTVRASRGETAGDFGFTAVLEEKPAGRSWRSLKGSASPEGLGTFESAADGSAAMVRRINVRGLRLGSAYRLKVSFRWVTPSGKRRVTRRSAACTVKEMRPNVGIARARSWIPGTSGDQVVYRPQLRVKRGARLAGGKVTISVLQGTTLLGRVTPQSLSNRGLVLIPGTPCEAGADVTYRVEVDPAIEESRTADNELTVRCSPGRAAGR